MRILKSVLALAASVLLAGCVSLDEPASTSSQQSSTQSSSSSRAASTADFLRGAEVGGTPDEMGQIAWGDLVVSLYGNGGLRTREGSIFHDHELNFTLVDRNKMDGQIDAYERGQTKWIRGTFGMVALAIAERGLCDPADMSMCPVMVGQRTFSLGDHVVATEDIKTLADLSGKDGRKVRVALMRKGPHVKLLFELVDEVNLLLKNQKFTIDDIEIVWCEELFGSKGPDGALRQGRADVAFVITSPGLLELTGNSEDEGGPNSVGDGSEQSVLGAHMIASTHERMRSIADTVWVSPQELEENPEGVLAEEVAFWVAWEQVDALEKQHERTGGSDEFIALMDLTGKIVSPDDPLNAEGAYGLFQDAQFVGHTGNVKFLDPQNEHGFDHFARESNKVAKQLGYITQDVAFQHVPVSFWANPEFREHLSKSIDVQVQSRFNKEALQAELDSMDALTFESRRSHYFTVFYEPEQTTFPMSRYGEQFEGALEFAKSYPRSALVVTGHADPGATLGDFVKASGLRGDEDPRTGEVSRYVYVGNGRGESIDIRNTNQVLAEIDRMDPSKIPGGINPRDTARAAMDMSLERAQNVEAAFLQMLQQQGIDYDPNQITVRGMGVTSPKIARPLTNDDMARNRCVEFNFIRVSGEALNESDLDF